MCLKKMFKMICAVSLIGSNFVSASGASSSENLDLFVSKALEKFDIPGASIGIVMNGEVVLAKGYGMRDLAAGLPVTEDTLFAIGSCSKAFTTFVLGQMVDEGKIAWDDLVIKHLPGFRLQDAHATDHMTIRDLLTHRSGLPRHDFVWYNSKIPRGEFLKRLPHLPFSYDLRAKFQYNNLMYVVAGLLIEKVTGLTWEEAVQSRIFAPLGMDNSNFSVDQSQLSNDFAQPYAEEQGAMRLISFQNISNIGPAGSINSSASQMVKWIQLQLSDGKGLIKNTTLQEMHLIQTPVQAQHATSPDESPYIFGYGLGWLTGWYKGDYTVMHTGGIDGFRSAIVLLPQKKMGIVVLTNSDKHKIFATRAAYAIIDQVMGREEDSWLIQVEEQEKSKALTKQEIEILLPSKLPLECYAGEFENPGYGTMQLFLDGNDLFAIFNDETYILTYKNNGNFIASMKKKNSNKFECSFNDEVSEFRISFESSVPPIIFKRTT